ncbi:hypothetical protein [Acholeplasma hippikon]|uniref:Alternate signal-mediated exported protein, CPF_0494 family n=1 Tax=Acholeplasma hippikon TaxID=264636 RepID=A0A449BLM5_9MOLU|nr:hypothetical protein [Acholeplasma hippikon]VEU83332.1 Uncharacterised protein [Acholeplasma hippikon]
MKNKKLLMLILGLVLALGVTTTGILAWLTDTKTTTPIEFTVGEVKYTWNSGTTKTTPVVPGENVLSSSFSLTNGSTVTSELRMIISVMYDTNVDGLSLVDLTLGSNWVLDNGYYYYRVGNEVDGKYPIPTTTTSISVLEGLSLKGSLVGNNFIGKTFIISITFQAKQNDYATWTDLGSINFATGLA